MGQEKNRAAMKRARVLFWIIVAAVVILCAAFMV